MRIDQAEIAASTTRPERSLRPCARGEIVSAEREAARWRIRGAFRSGRAGASPDVIAGPNWPFERMGNTATVPPA